MPEVAAARAGYDAIAETYDGAVAPSAWVRERLWERLDALFPPGSRVLDVTAGTGLDVLHFVERGVRVTACDVSPGMLARLSAKAPSVAAFVADLQDLVLNASFDGVISTFAGLNAAVDLSGFARAAARLVRPGGVLFLHVLNPRGKGERRTFEVAGVPVPHRLWSPRALAQTFAGDFRAARTAWQGILRRVDDPSGSWDRWERLASALPGLRGLGTFYSLELIRLG